MVFIKLSKNVKLIRRRTNYMKVQNLTNLEMGVEGIKREIKVETTIKLRQE